MKIAITSQNFRTITGHAGKTRRFLVYAVDGPGAVREVERFDLPKAMSLHEYHGDDHPVFACDVVVTASCGERFRSRLEGRGVRVVATSASDPLAAAQDISRGADLPPPLVAHLHG